MVLSRLEGERGKEGSVGYQGDLNSGREKEEKRKSWVAMGSEPTKEKEKRERRKEEKCSESVEHDLTKEKKEKREKSKRGVYDMIYYIVSGAPK